MSLPSALRQRSTSPVANSATLSGRARFQDFPHVITVRRPPRPSVVFDTYWKFATERQAIYHARVNGSPLPWTHDAILSGHRFTNAYRAADRVSQYLIQEVIYRGEYDWPSTMLRVLLFKIFNKISTWELIQSQVGVITAGDFSAPRISRVLDRAIESGASIYSGAYIMPSGPASRRQARKHHMHLALLEELRHGELTQRLADAASLQEIYELILAVPSFGPFLAYQYAIDLNYSPYLNFSEMDFVVPGPGARDGIRKCFDDLGDYNEADTIRWVADWQQSELEKRNLQFRSLWGRPLQLIDCQNLFCEVDKYARVAHPDVKGLSGRSRIKQRFLPQSEPLKPWFPPKWGLNECVSSSDAAGPLARIG
jgi:hypothetical protein